MSPPYTKMIVPIGIIRGFNVFACLLVPLAFFAGFWIPEFCMPAVLLLFFTAFLYWLFIRLQPGIKTIKWKRSVPVD